MLLIQAIIVLKPSSRNDPKKAVPVYPVRFVPLSIPSISFLARLCSPSIRILDSFSTHISRQSFLLHLSPFRSHFLLHSTRLCRFFFTFSPLDLRFPRFSPEQPIMSVGVKATFVYLIPRYNYRQTGYRWLLRALPLAYSSETSRDRR